MQEMDVISVFIRPKRKQGTLNKAFRRIIWDCNDEQLVGNEKALVLLPRFSCHSLRHTFTTKLMEAGMNLKVVKVSHITVVQGCKSAYGM